MILKNLKTTLLISLIIIVSFCFGFAYKSMLILKSEKSIGYKKVTGIGGVFFKCKNPVALKEWYKTNLGLNTNEYGAVFEWRQGADTTQKGFTQWSPFNEKTKYFEPSTKDYMINYRVANITALIEELKQNKVTIVDTIESYDYGKFIHIMDPEGNKIELWEPNDIVFEKLGTQLEYPTTK